MLHLRRPQPGKRDMKAQLRSLLTRKSSKFSSSLLVTAGVSVKIAGVYQVQNGGQVKTSYLGLAVPWLISDYQEKMESNESPGKNVESKGGITTLKTCVAIQLLSSSWLYIYIYINVRVRGRLGEFGPDMQINSGLYSTYRSFFSNSFLAHIFRSFKFYGLDSLKKKD